MRFEDSFSTTSFTVSCIGGYDFTIPVPWPKCISGNQLPSFIIHSVYSLRMLHCNYFRNHLSCPAKRPCYARCWLCCLKGPWSSLRTLSDCIVQAKSFYGVQQRQSTCAYLWWTCWRQSFVTSSRWARSLWYRRR